MTFEQQLFVPQHQRRQKSEAVRARLTLLDTGASVSTGTCDGLIPCSSNKGPVSATTVQHKGQKSPVYFRLETFK